QHRRGSYPLPAQDLHDLVAVTPPGPGADPLVQLRARSTAPRGSGRAVDAGHVTQRAPFRVVPDAERHPPVRAPAPVHAMWCGDGIGVPGAARYPSVRGEFEDRGREELQSGLVLREVDGAPGPGTLSPLERSEHGDRAVADGDVVDVRPVEKHGGRVRLAEQLDESGESAQLTAVSGMEGVRSGLALVAAREDDQPGVIRAKRLSSEAKARDGAGGEALDEHVGGADERSRELHALRMLQVERRASLTVVVEGEHPRTIGLDDAVLERRVCRAEDVGGKAALEADDLRAEIREVFADERPRRGEPHLDDPEAAERAATDRDRRSCRDLGHTTPAARRRASCPGPTPTSA